MCQIRAWNFLGSTLLHWSNSTPSPLVLSVVRLRKQLLFSRHTRLQRPCTRAALGCSCSNPGRCGTCRWCQRVVVCSGALVSASGTGHWVSCPNQARLDKHLEYLCNIPFLQLHLSFSRLNHTAETWFCVGFSSILMRAMSVHPGRKIGKDLSIDLSVALVGTSTIFPGTSQWGFFVEPYQSIPYNISVVLCGLHQESCPCY